MTLRAGVDIIGNSAPLEAALGRAAGATEDFAKTYLSAFKGMSVSTLELASAQDKLALSMDRYGAGTLGAANATLRYQKTIDSLKASQLEAASQIGRTLTTFVTAPVLLAGFAAVKLGTDFQSAMLRIQTQAGASATEVQKMNGAVLALAKGGAQQGPLELANALYYLESRGLRGTAAINALKVASNAAALGQANLTDTANALGGAIVSNVKGAQDYQQAMGTLNAIVGGGAMTMQDLTDALGTGLLSNAKLVGVSLTEVGAALDVLVDRGVPAQQAATRLGATLKLMSDPAPVAQKALAAMGIGANELAIDLQKPNGLLLALQRLKEGVDSVGKVQGEQDLASAFGRSRQSSAIITLVQSLDAPVSGYAQKVNQVIASTGKLTSSEAEQQHTAAASFHRDIAEMEAILIGLGNAILPTVTKVANGVTEIAGAFSGLPGPVKQDIGIVVGLLAVGGPVILGAAAATRAVKSIGTAFTTIPVRAGPALAKTDAEVAGLGASAVTAEGKVAGLRAGLLGLAAKAFVATLILDIVPKSSAGKGVLDKVFGNTVGNALAGIPGLGGVDTQAALGAAKLGAAITGDSIIPTGPTSTTEYNALRKKATAGGMNRHNLTSDDVDVISGITLAQIVKLKPYFASNADYLQVADQKISSLNLNPNVTAEDLQAFSAGWTPKQINELNGQLEKMKGYGGKTSPTATTAAAPKLTKAEQIQAGLYLDPNNVALLKEKLAMDDKQLADAQKAFADGKITKTKYLSLLQQYGTDRSATEASIKSATTKTTSASNKKKAAAAKAQREYASGVSTHAESLITAVSAAGGTGHDGKPSTADSKARDAEITFFKDEAKDSKLTAAERARYAAEAVAAKKGENAAALKDALTYESTIISGLKARVAQAKASKGNVAGQEAALRNLIAGYESEAANKELTPTQRNDARQHAATARGQLNNLRNNPQVPLPLQLAAAQASSSDQGATSEQDVQAALAIKKWDEKLLKAHTLSLQGQIAIYDDIAQQNQVLGQGVTRGYAKTL
ncbi:MAG TPA: phage tail tape measure protein, partial [Gaiellaceae bacterium]|nr:phage tail tape measure protein [Gaiellaceae bacterium]